VRISINKKISAGALQYTLFVSVLIVLLISTFLMLTFLQNHFKTKANFHVQSIQNADLGFQFIADNNISYEEEKSIEISSAINSYISLTKKHWGVFDLVTVKSNVNDILFQKTGIIGGFQKEKPALYLEDNNSALVLVGNTKIQGSTFLPKNGVKRGNIAGNSYYGEQLIYGAIKQSNENLPVIKNRNYIKELSKGLVVVANSNDLLLEEGLKSINSFSNPIKIYKQEGTINLREIHLTGNIIIQSDTLIRVYKTAELSDVILVAPSIEIGDFVTGNFQGFSTKNITVGANCNLMYPSALVLNEKIVSNTIHKNNSFSQLKINSNTLIKGIVAFLATDETNNYKPQLVLEEQAIITGEVYCEKNFELKGMVNGSVYTSGFIANQYGSVYQNHIYNGEIIQSNLPQQYVGLSLENANPTIAKWVY